MRVLITGGASGQLRHELVRTAPIDVTLVGTAGTDGGTRLDVTDARAVAERVERLAPDVVINAAAYTAVDRAESEPDAARALNVDAVRHLAESALDVGARLVHVSTDFVFGGGAANADGTDAGAPPFAEDAPTSPLGVYGRTKRDGEQVVRAVLPESGTIVRTSWVYSAHGGNFVKTMLLLMNQRDEIGVVADQIGSPTWARSLAEALWRTVEVGATGTLHWSGAGVASWYDLAVAVLEEGRSLGLVAGSPRVSPLRTEQYPTPAPRAASSVLETSRTRERLDLPAVHWREDLRAMLGELA